MTVYDPASTPAPLSRLARIGRRLSFASLLCAAALALTVPACGDDPKPDDNENNAANNNPVNNNPVNNNPVNNNPVNNNPNNPVNNNPNNPVNNNPDPVAACMEACTTLGTTCRDEFLAECPMQVVDGLIPACQEGCNDPEARAQIEAVAGLPCATVVPLAISGFGLSELCADPVDLCEGVTCDAGSTCDPADGMCKPDATDLCEGITCDAGETCDPADGMCKPDAVDLCAEVTCDAGETCDPADGMCKPDAVDLCEGVVCDEGEVCNPADGMCGEPPACGDAYEPNENRAGAVALEAGSYEGLTICTADDEDWYAITVAEGDNLYITVAFTDDDGDIDATLFSGDSTTSLDSSASGRDNEYLVGLNLTAGIYKLRVYGFSDATNTYDLNVQINPELDLCNATNACDTGETCTERQLCVSSGTCEVQRDCAVDITCTDGACVECTTNDECDSNLCNADNTCAECTTGDDCFSGICNPDNTCAECADDNDCGFLETCDTVTNTCVECADDNDCFGGEVCNPTGICVECTTNDHCDSGLCLEDNSCAECVTDDQCPSSFTCNPSDFSCELTACDGTPDNNDTFADAELIVPSTFDGVICGGESDWYTIEVLEGDSLSLELYFSDDLGDIELSLNSLNQDGTATTNITSSVSSTDNEFISRNDLAAGTYYIRVYGVTGVSNAYTLTARVGTDFTACSATADCETGETCSTRKVCITTGTCEQNIDCSFSAPICEAGACVECTTNDQCDSNLCNLDNTCAECTTDDNCASNEVCDIATNNCIQCFTADDCDSGEVCTEDGFCAPGLCGGQQLFEPNNSREAAVPLTDGSYDLAICGADDDWFAITVEEGGSINVALEFIDDIGDIDASLNRLNGDNTLTAISTAGSTSDNEYLTGDALPAGTYYLRVFGYSNAQNAYTLHLLSGVDVSVCAVNADCEAGESCTTRKLCLPTGTCDLDVDCSGTTRICNLADNTCVGCIDDEDCRAAQTCNEDTLACVCTADSLGDISSRELAYDLSLNDVPTETLSICSGGQDFFAIDLLAGQTITVDLFFTHFSGGDIELVLQSSTGTELAGSRSSSDNERVTRAITTDGRYYIRVYGAGTSSNAYTITVNVQ